MRRRVFLQTTTAGLATLLARPLRALPSDSPYVKTIGLQLYTLREQLEKDVPGTLQAVAEAGYYQVELMKVVGGEEVMRAASDAGLKITSAMIDWQTIVTPGQAGVASFAETLDVAAQHQLKYLVIPYIARGHRDTVDQLKAFARRANRAGEACRRAGMQLCYHHHSFEFEKLSGGQSGWDVFVAQFDPELVKFEIDVFWAAIGGMDPVKLIRDLQGRVAQLHLKDLLQGTPTIYDESKVPREAFREVGGGTLDWQSILAAAADTHVAQCHVEQDHSPNPLISIRQSIEHLKKL